MNPNDNDDRQGPLPEWSQRAAQRMAQRAGQPAGQRQADPIPERTGDALALSDDKLRHHSAARLAEQLDIVTGLAEHCERMASLPSQDRIAPVHAAARVLTASAHVATALARMTSAESRQRRIIEHIQTIATKKPYSNSTLDAVTENGAQNPNLSQQDLAQQAAAALDGLLFDTLQRKMLLYMNLVASKTFDADLKKAYPEAYAPGGALGEPSPKPSTPA